MKLVLLLTAIVAVSCVSRPEREVDLNLIDTYSEALEKTRPFEPPYMATFSTGFKSLYYVAATHAEAVAYPDLLKSPTFLTIKNMFEKHRIDAIVIEGIPHWKGSFPLSLSHFGDQCEKTKYRLDCGEPWYTIQLAKKNGAAIFTGEPTDAEILNFVKTKGYTTTDLLGFYVVRQIPEWRRDGVYRKKLAKSLIENLLDHERRTNQFSGAFGFNEFESWYHSKMPQPADYNEVNTNDTGPFSDARATYVQKMASTVDISRNRAIVLQISEALKTYSNVLVVYGSGHFPVQRRALKSLMGSAPTYEKLAATNPAKN